MRHLIMTVLACAALPALAEVPTVVTDIPPVHSLAAQVMGDLGQPVLLLAQGADEHDFQLRPSQARVVAEAGLVVWIGPELTPWLEAALANRPDGAAALALLDAPETLTRAGAAAETDPGHDHAGTDPHAWLDADNGRVWLGLIAAELGRLDPANATTYDANAAAAGLALDALDLELAAGLGPVRDRPFVTHHDAFGYFAAQYGLTIAGTIARGDAAPPGAERLSTLRATLRSGPPICIFPEGQHDPALAEQMAEGTGARIGGALDPVGSSLAAGPDLYAALLRGLARTILDCAGG